MAKRRDSLAPIAQWERFDAENDRYRSVLVGHIHMLRWVGLAMALDPARLLEYMEAEKERLGRQLAHITVVNEGAPLMPDEVKKEIQRLSPRFRACCDAVLIVVNDQYFGATRAISRVTDCVQSVIGYHMWISTHASATAAFRRLYSDPKQISTLLRAATTHGIID